MQSPKQSQIHNHNCFLLLFLVLAVTFGSICMQRPPLASIQLRNGRGDKGPEYGPRSLAFETRRGIRLEQTALGRRSLTPLSW